MTQEYKGFPSWNAWSEARREIERRIEQTTIGSPEWKERMQELIKFDAEHQDK